MNRKIDIQNYEAWFIDYLDGTLSEAEIIALENFLLGHPELRNELEGLEESYIHPEELKLPLPENLKQIDLDLPVNEKNLDFFLIAEQEGDLSIQQLQELSEYLEAHPSQQKHKNAIAAARLIPEMNLSLANKYSLKKSLVIVYRLELRTFAAIAAGIALLFTFWLGFMDRGSELNNLAVTDIDKKETTTVTDSTSTAEPAEEKSTSPVTIPEKQKQAVKKAAVKISFKTGIPIASATLPEPSAEEIFSEDLDRSSILKNVRIDPSMIAFVSPVTPPTYGTPEIKMTHLPENKPKAANPSEYMTLGEFAVQKLTDIVFPKEKKDLNAINLASAGLEKINEVAGTNMKLEAAARGENDKVLSFNSRLISFTTPINRE